MCRLCLKESFFILFHPETASLNKKNEIYQSCKHKYFKFLADCKITWSHKFNPKALSLLMRKLCSITNHNLVSVLADESLMKQICTNISNTVMKQLFLSLLTQLNSIYKYIYICNNAYFQTYFPLRFWTTACQCWWPTSSCFPQTLSNWKIRKWSRKYR